MGRKKKKMENLRIRRQRPQVQLAFEFLAQICVEKKKGRPTKSPKNGESNDSGPAQLSLPF